MSTIDDSEHPLFSRNVFRLETPAMKTLHDTILQWLWTGATGGLITGTARVGKTTAIREVMDQLYTRSNIRIPAYYVSAADRDSKTIRSIFWRLCMGAGMHVSRGETADTLSELYQHYIEDQAVEKDCSKAVLAVDEMQSLTLEQFSPFVELYNNLSVVNVDLFVIFVGNEQQCEGLLERIRQPSHAHIHGRFFTRHTRVLGLTSKDEVHQCLKQYDQLRFPVDGPTYTEYFMPNAFQRGWRLASLSGDVWRIFREYQRSYSIESWGMQYFTSAITTLLTDFLPQYGVDHFDDEVVKECINISGIVSSLVSVRK
jgi:hypothetical protein